MTGEHDLGVIRTVSEFRDSINQQPTLSTEDRLLLIEQAQVLIGDLYTHLPLKRAMHSIDPLQRLRLLKQHVDEMSITEFHAELLEIFKELRDLHTNYSLPIPFGGQIAFLGILVEQYFDEKGKTKYMVSKVAEHLVSDDDLEQGVEITHWNGMPIHLAVARNADKEAGSNLAARLARGLENLTLRFMRASLPPDEDWVTITYLVNGIEQETRLDWQVFESGAELLQGSDDPAGLIEMLNTPLRYQIGMDERAERFRRAKKRLFNPDAVVEEKRVADFKGKVPPTTDALKKANVIATSRPDEITARIVETDSGKFGYLRLWSFFMNDYNVSAFLVEVIRLLTEELPNNGLIIDVRGNGGGFVIASEFLLQFLTPRHITPEPSQFIATAATLDLAKAVPSMEPWVDSLEQAVSTGALHSAGIPLSPEDLINSIGQLYFAPVVLLTDAYCYSACDMFAAGFQDHDIGIILGVDDATGAGGANVLGHDMLVEDWEDGPLEPLPGGASMRVSLRRTLRVGKRSGQVVEDIGVKPDLLHEMTAVDLLQSNRDLLNQAGALLAEGKPRKLDVDFSKSWKTLKVKVTTENIDSVDVYVNDRPVSESVEMDYNAATIRIPKPGEGDTMRIEGWSGGELVAMRKLSGPFD